MMQANKVTTPAIPRARNPENLKFANDGSYESIRPQLCNLARRCFARVAAMGLSMTFDDVLQEMNMSYLLAKERWSPDHGTLFVTYMTTCCYRNFNERIRRAEMERRHLGLVNLSDMRSQEYADAEDMDYMEVADGEGMSELSVSSFYGNDLIEGVAVPTVAPPGHDPARLIEFVQETAIAAQESAQRLNSLTQVAKSMVAELLIAARDRADENDRLPKFSEILKKHGLSEVERRRVRKELALAFGVKV